MDTLEKILKSFGQTFDQYIEQKPVFSKGSKSGTVEYIPWFSLCDILDTYAPGWEWELSCDYHGDRTVVIGKLTIHGSDRSISRSATGNEDSNCGSFGDPCSNAEAMALRRACAKFGIARYLWAKDEKPKSNQQPSSTFKTTPPREKGTISREEWLARQKRSEGIDTMIHQTMLDEQPRSDMFGD
jgi:hypothetical protein